MIINKCLVVGDIEYVGEDVIDEILKDMVVDQGIEDEALALISGVKPYRIEGSKEDFNLISEDIELRCIHEKDIDNIYRDEAYEVYDEDQWRSEVAANGTTEGYDDWVESIVDEADYGSFFASYDGVEDTIGKYYIFRTG